MTKRPWTKPQNAAPPSLPPVARQPKHQGPKLPVIPPMPPLPLPPPPAPTPPEPDPQGMTAYQLREIQRIAAEMARRKIEGLKLYEPLPEQEAFHASQTRQRLLRGSNRGGKTLPAAVEVARAICGMDPTGKYPTEGGRCFAVGKDLSHVGAVMWRKLGRAGAFRIIRDLDSGAWRSFRPWTPEDAGREKEAKLAPPLIPPRLIQSIAWENKAKNIPKMVTLKNGWEITFFSSESKPPQGSDIDLWWFDEEIIDEDWYPEMCARVLDRRGRGVWSATPQAGTQRLLELHERAADEKELVAGGQLARLGVEEFVILLDNNPHISELEKIELWNSLREDERDVRIGGNFAINSLMIFPEFSVKTHGLEPFVVPPEWSRYAVIDPGRQVCAVLFAAVPPPEIGDFVYLYDELYIQNCDAAQFGQAMARKARGQTFQAFVIDDHGARMHDIGSGMSVRRQYMRALKKNGVRSLRTGYGFSIGNDDVAAGIEAFRDWLSPRENKPAKLRIIKGKVQNLVWEIRHYRYKRIKETITDKPEERGRVHQMANCRYLALYRPRYVVPKAEQREPSGAYSAYKEKLKRLADKSGGEMVNLGPGGNRARSGRHD